MTRTSLLLSIGWVAMGCAYYNGLYNANRLVDEAHRAEREGRRGEARSLWAQAAVKAESVVTRYPGSRYRDDALLVQGRALSRIGECRSAVDPLGVALTVSPDQAIRAEAGLLLGQCFLAIGRPDSARKVVAALLDHVDDDVVSRARWILGRGWLADGSPEEALRELDATNEPDAAFDRALAHAWRGRARDAAASLETAYALPFDERQWDSVLTEIGAADVRTASAVVDRLFERRRDLSAGVRARLLITDGDRWAIRDPAFADARYLAAARTAADSLDGRLARAKHLIADLRGTSDPARLEEFDRELRALAVEGGQVTVAVGPIAAAVTRLVASVRDPHPDPLVGFRVAEETRDSLGARPLAARLFADLARRLPASVVAPKAILAAAALDPPYADSLIQVLRRDYPDSPYTQAAFGRPAPRLTAVEDSLRDAAEALGRGSGRRRHDLPLPSERSR